MSQEVAGTRLRVAIVGAGAMGGALAGGLHRSGHHVTVVDVAQPLVDQVNAEGLRVREPDGGEYAARVTATTDPATLGKADAVVVFVKAQHTPAAAVTARRLTGPDTVVATLQNGWGNADVLAAQVPADQLVMGVTYHSATVTGPGKVAHTGTGPTVVGPYTDGGDLTPAKTLAGLLTAAGFPAEASAEVKTEVWRKLVLNAATLPTAALTGLRAGEVAQPGALLDLVDALAAEAVTVARAIGLPIDLDERVQRIHAVLQGAGQGKASMLQDVEARRKTEVEVVNGAIVRAAEQAGVDVPLNRAMVALVNGVERSWRR